MIEFPKMLYRAGNALEWEGRKLATLIVHSAADEAAAIEAGWQRVEELVSGPKRKRG